MVSILINAPAQQGITLPPYHEQGVAQARFIKPKGVN
jgi:hypothetical protein